MLVSPPIELRVRIPWLTLTVSLAAVGFGVLLYTGIPDPFAAQEAGTDVGHSVYASRFGMLHGVSSLFYIIESLLGLVLVWKLPAGADAEAGAARGRGAARISSGKMMG